MNALIVKGTRRRIAKILPGHAQMDLRGPGDIEHCNGNGIRTYHDVNRRILKGT